MLRITIEIVPGGVEELAEVLQTTYIVNDLSSNSVEFGNYAVYAEEDPRDSDAPIAHIYRHARFQPGALATLAYRALVQRASILKEKVPQ